MTLYVIEDDDGFVLDRVYLEFTSDVDRAMLFDEPIAPAEYAKRYCGHVVELVEKPEPVETREDTVAKILREAKRYADDYISEDKLKFEIKTALSVYKPAPEVVSEAEAEMLDALSDGELMPICELSYYVHHAESLSEKEAVKREDRLMRAYVNGYTVVKEKKYNVKVPYAAGWHFQKYSSASKLGARNNWRPFPAKDIDSNMSKELFQFTEAEIDHYGLQYCEKEEVTDDEL